jgi:type II secretory pathway pseudopilin PulG
MTGRFRRQLTDGTRSNGFTFVEVLAALTFLAILVPTLLGALNVSNRASVVAERSGVAAQLADNKLNELTLDNTWASAESRGDFGADLPGYRWELKQEQWDVDSSTTNGMTQLALDVFFTVQGHEHSIRLTTLAAQQAGTTSSSSSVPSTAHSLPSTSR